jgi:hypothetical protein
MWKEIMQAMTLYRRSVSQPYIAWQVGTTVNEEYEVAKTLFGKCVSELGFCAYLSEVCSYAPVQSTIYFCNLTNKC